MTSVPLHPALVHIPLGLAFVIPLLAAIAAWALWTGRARPRAWALVVALQAVLLAAGLVAMNTGEREEERVEGTVPESAIGRHEAYAEQFVWATGITLAIAGLVLIVRQPAAARTLALASVAGTVIVSGAAIRVGHAGGELVYVHNAAAAYAGSETSRTATNPAARPVQQSRAGDRGGDDDDR